MMFDQNVRMPISTSTAHDVKKGPEPLAQILQYRFSECYLFREVIQNKYYW